MNFIWNIVVADACFIHFEHHLHHIHSFQLPLVCNYQAVDYVAALRENGSNVRREGNDVFQSNGTCRSNCSQSVVELTLLHGKLMPDRRYWVVVEVFTEAGSATATSRYFRKCVQPFSLEISSYTPLSSKPSTLHMCNCLPPLPCHNHHMHHYYAQSANKHSIIQLNFLSSQP